MYGFLVIHPGEHLKDEMEARGLTVSKAARQLGINKAELEEVLAGKAAITQALAEALEQAWETPASTWLNLQTRFDTHPKNSHGGKRAGAGRKPTGTISKILRVNAPEDQMAVIMNWLERQPNKARAVAEVLYKRASR